MKRKSIGSAFYKDKLIKMFDQMKKVVQNKLEHWEKTYEKDNKPMNIVEEINRIQIEIIMGCAFGEEVF